MIESSSADSRAPRLSAWQRVGTALIAACTVAVTGGAFIEWLWPMFLAGPLDWLWLTVPALGLGLLLSPLFVSPTWAGVLTGAAASLIGLTSAALAIPGRWLIWVLIALIAGLAGWAVGALLAKGRGVVPCFLAVAVAVLAAALAPAPLSDFSGPEDSLVVVGLDGATWRLIDRLRAEGELPNLTESAENGAAGILLSERPMLSPRVWTTLATGKPPSEHGVEDFYSTQNEDLRALRIWEILHARGHDVGVFQWLVTWPPDDLGLFIVPGWMARGAETRPAGLGFLKEIERAAQGGGTPYDRALPWVRGLLDYGLRFKSARRAGWRFATGVLVERRDLIRYASKRRIQLYLNADVFLYLYRSQRPDFATVVLYGTDNLAHKLWQYAYPEEFGLDPKESGPFARQLFAYYEEADAFIGELKRAMSESSTLAVVSDHGFQSLDRDSAAVAAEREWKPRITALAEIAGLELPEDATVSAVARQGYITLRGDDDRRDVQREEVVVRLTAIRLAEDGRRLFTVEGTGTGQLEVRLDGSIEVGDIDAESEVLDGEGRSFLLGDLLELEDRGGTHSLEGIIVLEGPAVQPGAKISARLIDLVPTLLYLSDLPVGQDMPGRVLAEGLKQSHLASDPVRSLPSWEEAIGPIPRDRVLTEDASEMEEQLRALGYIR